MTGAMVLLSGNALVFIEEMLLQGIWILLADHQIFAHLQVRESLLHPKRFDEKKRPSHPGEFVNIVTKFGDISSYEGIPAAELEICDNTSEFCSGRQGNSIACNHLIREAKGFASLDIRF
jgi:hypothetical protein